MDKENKGLADNYDGDFILNESGTSISNDVNEGGKNADDEISSLQPEIMDKVNKLSLKTDDPILSNDIASDEKSRMGEGEIKPYDDVFGDHKPHEDSEEISSTDDV